MVLLCFVLDLRSLSPPLLGDLKQALLQLGNFYAISSCRSDKIGLCYLIFDRISSSRQLKIAYSPRGNFSLHDFHHAVNTLPSDAFLPYINETSSISPHDLNLSRLLSDEVLYSWGDKDVVRRKVIFLTSCLDGIGNIDSVTRKTLMDAADKCVSVEFVLMEQKSNHLRHLSENIDEFVKQICDLENCCFHSYLPDSQTLNGLVKQWLRELKGDVEESLQARFIFKSNILGSVNSICCKLSLAASRIIDDFNPCQACRCHGIPIDDVVGNRIKGPSTCPITGQDLGALDFIENAVKVGNHTILFLPSSQSCLKFQQVLLPIELNIIERTNLGSLSEGVIIGTSYFVTPSTCHEIEYSDENDKSELNAQLFRGLCHALHSLDEGLVCASNCNIETMRETAFHCYYILEPSENGPMLLRRLAGSEEVLPVSDFNQTMDSSVTKEIENSIQASLLKMGLTDYNPVLHERGFHKKLNLLVKESLHFGSIPSKFNVSIAEANSTQLDSPEVTVLSNSPGEVTLKEDEVPRLDHAAGEDKTTACIEEEWEEQLIVTDFCKIRSPNSISKPDVEQLVLSPPTSSRQLDANTSRILERLEIPRQMKTKAVSPVITNTVTRGAGVQAKKPLFPFQPNHDADHGLIIASQPMKPSFQRVKRKHK